MNTRKSIFFTSDWHVGHENVIRFDQRPFRNTLHMHEVLINNYNSSVSKDGLCYFLGDCGLCKSEILGEVLSRLNGTKVCILGNHDKGESAMYKLGFDVVLYGAKLVIAGHTVTLSHCPLTGLYREDVIGMKGAVLGENWHGESRLGWYSFQNLDQFHLHGHTHKKPEDRTLLKQFDVGVRANNYRPISISTIESWIAKYGR